MDPSPSAPRSGVRCLPEIDLSAAVDAAADAAYVAVGFALLAVQRVQVRRRDLTKAVAGRVEDGRAQVEEVVAQVRAAHRQVRSRLSVPG